jgi:6-pyruvoyl-tetrahydropterin synthase
VTDDEHVVLDFSAGKKQIKSIIDDATLGFDHKLIIFPNSNQVTRNLRDGMTKIVTPFVEAIVPTNTIQYSIGSNLAFSIEQLLEFKFPELKFKVRLEADGFTNSHTYFNYVHGLKNSSSWGCQNIHHGHTSFVEVFNTITKEPNGVLARIVADLFDDRILICRENILHHSDNGLLVSYKSERGMMTALYSNLNNWLILETETTIEYMAEYIHQNLNETLKGYTVNISEGLQKGCLIHV